MNKNRLVQLTLVATITLCAARFAQADMPAPVGGQQFQSKHEQKAQTKLEQKANSKKEFEQTPKAEQKTPSQKQPTTPRPAPAPRAPTATIAPSQVTLKLERGGKIKVSNRAGRVTIIGSDRETIQAVATSDEGGEPVQVEVGEEASRPRVILSIPSIDSRRAAREINLSVKVPRYAEVEILDNYRGTIEVSDLETGVTISGGNGPVTVNRVAALRVARRSGTITAKSITGNLFARTLNGNIVADDIGGQVDVAATNGSVRVHNAGGDLRANSSTGDIEILCVKGRAEVSSASGSIDLTGIGSDTDASSASGSVSFKGAIRANGSYSLKSISGEVQMSIQPDAPGFTATLITYSGDVESDFALKVDAPLQEGKLNRRVTGRYGDGQARFLLDSFSGTVRIAKIAPAALKACK